MRRIVLPLLFALLSLTLATSASAQVLFSTMPPETPSPVGFGPLGPPHPTNPIPAVSWTCAFSGGCNVTDIHFSEFANNGLMPQPTLMDIVNLSTSPFAFSGTPGNIAEFSAPIVSGAVSGLGCFTITGVTWCNETIDVKATVGAIHVPQGTNWITLYGENISEGGDTFWSSSGLTSIISTTLSQDPKTGVITQFPSQLAFTVTGTPAVPEPSSMVLLGTGILGLAGVLRRKLMR